jgi:hypothetical protein
MPDLGTSMTKLKLSRYRSLTPFTVHDVVVSAGVFDAQRSRHRGKKTVLDDVAWYVSMELEVHQGQGCSSPQPW